MATTTFNPAVQSPVPFDSSSSVAGNASGDQTNANDNNCWTTAAKTAIVILGVIASIATFAVAGPVPGLVVTLITALTAMSLFNPNFDLSNIHLHFTNFISNLPVSTSTTIITPGRAAPQPGYLPNQMGMNNNPPVSMGPAFTRVVKGGGHYVPVQTQQTVVVPVVQPTVQILQTFQPVTTQLSPHVEKGGGHYVPAPQQTVVVPVVQPTVQIPQTFQPVTTQLSPHVEKGGGHYVPAPQQTVVVPAQPTIVPVVSQPTVQVPQTLQPVLPPPSGSYRSRRGSQP